MATHVKVIAVLFLCCGAFFLLGVFFAPAILGLVAALVRSSGEQDAETASAILGVTGVAVSVLFAVLAAPFLATGWGMLKLKPWARIAGIVLGALSLVSFPLGTAIGVYALVILFRKDAEALFLAQVQGQTVKQ